MKSIFFISDIHFGLLDQEQERIRQQRFLSFLEHVSSKGEHLYILGDLFDFWFEYRHVIPRGYHRILAALQALVEQGIPITYLAGNHDFWLLDFFPKELGISVSREPFAVYHCGKHIFLHHGDGLAQKDMGYRILKRILRNRFNIFLFSLLHPDVAACIAKTSSRSSRKYTAHKDYGETDGMVACAKRMLNSGYDLVIMGHRHEPAKMVIDSGIYINLGDWLTHYTYLELNKHSIELRYWT